MRKIIWTRSERDQVADQQLFTDVDRVIWIPCVEMKSLPYEEMKPLGGPCAFAFTSAQAVEEVQRHPRLLALLQQAVWVGTFGEKTYQKLREIEGVAPCWLAADSAEAFAERVVQEAGEKAATWMLPGPTKRAFPLAAYLKQQGWQVREVDLYETHTQVPAGYDPEAMLVSGAPYALCLASPSAARGFCHWLPTHFDATRFQVYVLGESTRQACEERFGAVEVVRPQSLAALVAASWG